MHKSSIAFPFLLWAAALPFGVALQNAVGACAFLWVLYLRHKAQLPLARGPLRTACAWSLCFVLWIAFASVLNPVAPQGAALQAFGFCLWVFAPLLWQPLLQPYLQQNGEKVLKVMAAALALVGIVVISQSIVGWKIAGTSVVLIEDRPRGLYSHPLSLAYAVLLCWPVVLAWLLQKPRKVLPYIAFAGAALALWLSESRTVQAVAAAQAMFSLATQLAPYYRKRALLVVLTALVLLLVIPNRMSEKFTRTFNGQGVDRYSSYADDRFAFWHVHWEMFKERPILGHGYAINTAYRLPYYEKLGLGDFKKKYEAHNTYLQMLTNGGIPALVFFLAWALSWGLLIWRAQQRFFALIAAQTLGGFLAASLLQNAFQDAAVRMVLVFVCTVFAALQKPT